MVANEEAKESLKDPKEDSMETQADDSVDASTDGETGKKTKKKPKKKSKRIRTFFSDFKTFIAKGNIVNLAVAVVIGAAFGAVVTALVNDFIMPLLALAVGQNGLESLKWTLVPANEFGEGGIHILWGDFLQKVIDFLIISFFIFLTLRLLMNAQKGLTRAHKKWLKKLKKNPELAKNPPKEFESEIENVVKATSVLQEIESSEDILRDIRSLIATMAQKETLQPPPQDESPSPHEERGRDGTTIDG